MKYVFLGGASEVGASCMLLYIADYKILIDCGVRVNNNGIASLPDLTRLKELAPDLDGIYISHAHADHVGALPIVHRMYPDTRIHMTMATQALSYAMLRNVSEMKRLENKPLYTREDVEQTYKNVIGL